LRDVFSHSWLPLPGLIACLPHWAKWLIDPIRFAFSQTHAFHRFLKLSAAAIS
jgi:hypothetical protein